MLSISLSGLSNQQMKMMVTCGLGSSSIAMPSLGNCGRYDFDDRGGKRNYMRAGNSAAIKKTISPLASSALTESRNSSKANFYKKVLESARDKFSKEISFKLEDKDISLAKALLYVAAEDEAFLAYNREMDACSLQNERSDTSSPSEAQGWDPDDMDAMPLAGKSINEWLAELDTIAKEVEAELVSRDIGCYLSEVLEAVNKVLFELRGFKRSQVIVDSKCTYLHSVLSSRCSSAILLSVIYMEVCRRLNLTVVGSPVGEEFLIWPLSGNPEELFRVSCGRSLFGVVNGECVDDPRSKASDIDSNSLVGLDIATNRDIVGIALANLIRLYWKRASRKHHGLMLTSPLRSAYRPEEKFNKDTGSSRPLLRPQDLRLAMMASERLLILQPHKWAFRRDYGMMLYYNRDYEAAVRELSICMAFAPDEESNVLEPFVEKLHLMRLN